MNRDPTGSPSGGAGGGAGGGAAGMPSGGAAGGGGAPGSVTSDGGLSATAVKFYAERTTKWPVRIVIIAGKGKSAVATRHIPRGEVLLQEEPFAAAQSLDNQEVVKACAKCMRFVGTLRDQLCLLSGLRDTAVPCMEEDVQTLSAIVPCARGCDNVYCSEACRDADATGGHWLLCPGPDRDPETPAAILRSIAEGTNDIIMVAAKCVARVLQDWQNNGGDFQAAIFPMLQFYWRHWWEVVAEEDLDSDPDQLRGQLQEILRDTAEVLASQFAPIFPKLDRSLFSVEILSRIVGAFELNSISVEISSPVADYMGCIAGLEPDVKAEAMKELGPTIAAIQARAAERACSDENDDDEDDDDDDDDDEDEDDEDDDDDHEDGHHGHSHHGRHGHSHGGHDDDSGEDESKQPSVGKLYPDCNGTALYTVLCCFNHSCTPNAGVAYMLGNSTAVVSALRDIEEGEEICISYIDEEQSYESRTAALRHYGFVCRCELCNMDSAAADFGSAGMEE